MCGLGICQAVTVLQTRWPQLLSPDAAAALSNHIRFQDVSPIFHAIVDLIVDPVNRGTQLPPAYHLDVGQLTLVSQHGNPVGFVLDTSRKSIRAVVKKRSGWKDHTTVATRAPDGCDDVLITASSQEVVDWLSWNWLS
jgi:hypothetical protein